MYESVCTALGTVASEVKASPGRNGPVAMFRFAVDHKKFDRAIQGYRTKDTSFVTVACYRGLAKNVESSLQVGERIIVYGSLKVSDFETAEGTRRSLKIEATSIGHDLLHGTAVFAKNPRVEQPSEPANEEVEQQLQAKLEHEDLATTVGQEAGRDADGALNGDGTGFGASEPSSGSPSGVA